MQAQNLGFFSRALSAGFIASYIMRNASDEFRDIELRKKGKHKTILNQDYKKEWIAQTTHLMFNGCLK